MSYDLSKESEKHLKILGEHWGTGYKPEIIKRALILAMDTEKPFSVQVKKAKSGGYTGSIFSGREMVKVVEGATSADVYREYSTYAGENS